MAKFWRTTPTTGGKYDNHELGGIDLVDDGIHRIYVSQVIMDHLEAVLVPDDDSRLFRVRYQKTWV